MKKPSIFALILAIAFTVWAAPASADLLFDRGLPTINLNNAAGASRSNVTWAETEATAANYWLVGDQFTLSGTQSYRVDTIRLWSTSADNLSLWFGTAGGTISQLSVAPTVTAVTYANGQSYQGGSGTYRNLYQVDFNVNMVLTGGTTYQFFLDGNQSGGIVQAYVHSSNAALSGSTQQGADNQLLALNIVSGAALTPEYWTSLGNGWDKASDANIQVYGSTVPVPGALLLFAPGLAGLALLRKRFKR